MDDPELTVDLERLRNLAAEAERVAQEIRAQHVPDLDPAALPGSAAAAAVTDADLATRRHGLAAGFGDWAATARATADTLAQADGAAAQGLVR